MSPTGLLVRSAAAATLAGAAVTAYAAREARQYTLRRVEVPLLPPGARSMRVLHVSDLHMTPGQRRKQEWVRGLAALEPDLVIDTGDNLSHRDAVPVVCDALGALLDVPGVFVHGSNDYFEPTLRNPLRYLLPDDGRRHTESPQLPWPELTRRFTDAGWRDLTNRRATVTVGDLTIAFAGVDDPHLSYDRLDEVAGPADPAADVRLGVAHAPYLRVLDQYAADGYDAIVAGHTHGGQVCLPGGRALTTNCDLEPARARGLHRHPADSHDGDPGSAWLHVSAGLGTNPYVRLRLACRPEATLLTLVARAPQG
ncbi:metallophosphoesterase [Nocardioides rubriscoriae]|uniref:metallophosphoesterase n=1 Tax=Nocardioides rubriscoriae TaxID=642762 RepID=UPI0011DF5B6A|nr:metallophosphoesterase [Nocardioides rubriscoriae]